MPGTGHVLLALATAVLAVMPRPSAAADRFNLPKGPGRELVYGHCQTCHDLQSVQDSAGIRQGAWDAVLANMADFGLRVSDDQRQRILEYLGTYLGPNPPVAAGSGTPAGETGLVDGAAVFADTCIACHQEGGVGKEDEFPPLAGNPDLFLSPDFPVRVVLNGIEGRITVLGADYAGAMPAFDFLSDDEIAAVLAHVRSSWGNAELRPPAFADPDAAAVAEFRAQPMAASDVAALRSSLQK